MVKNPKDVSTSKNKRMRKLEPGSKPTERGLIAEASTSINVPVAQVWNALTNPKMIKQYMFAAEVASDWKVGSSIVWKGEWKGRKYEDRGIILKLEPQRLLSYSHFSPLSGLSDSPENYHIVRIELSGTKTTTDVFLSQDNNSTKEERDHSEKNWKMMLPDLKRLLEKQYLTQEIEEH